MDIFFFELVEKSLTRISYKSAQILVDTRNKIFTPFATYICRKSLQKKYETIFLSFAIRRYLLFYSVAEKGKNIGIFLFFSFFEIFFSDIFPIEFSRYARLIEIILAKIRTMDTGDDLYDFSFAQNCARLRKIDICRTFYSVNTISHIDRVEIFAEKFIFGIAYFSYGRPECFSYFLS